MDPIVFSFTQPNVPLSINDAKGNPMRAYRLLKPWRRVVQVLARNYLINYRNRFGPWKPKPVEIQVELAFKVRRRRDPHNYTGTVVKALVDGIVAAGLIPDDTPDWVTIMDPVIMPVSPPGRIGIGTAKVHLRERSVT